MALYGRTGMGYDPGGRVAVIDLRFEDDDFLMGKFEDLDAADQFFGLAGKHAAGDGFQPAIPVSTVHLHST